MQNQLPDPLPEINNLADLDTPSKKFSPRDDDGHLRTKNVGRSMFIINNFKEENQHNLLNNVKDSQTLTQELKSKIAECLD